MTMRNAGPQAPLALAVALATGTCAAAPAIITVTDGGDAGTVSTCTLRQAIQSANGFAGGNCAAGGAASTTIVFSGNLVNSTITLTQGQLGVFAPLTIQGSGQIIDAGGTSRVLNVSGTSLTVSNLTLTGGKATYSGGVNIYNSTVSFYDTVISNNHVDTGLAVAGGVYAGYCNLVKFVRSTISGNTAGKGAGLVAAHSAVDLVDSTVSGNIAAQNFGGIDISYSTATLVNTTIQGNSQTANGGIGGGLTVSAGTALLTNSTVSGNSAAISAGVGADQLAGNPPSTITLHNSIIANNTGSGGDCYKPASGATVLAQNSLVLDGSCGINNGVNGNITGLNPQLGPLANNGGATMTMSLGEFSPALGTGSLGLATFNAIPLNYDQRGAGFPRTFGGAIDMGAFQRPPQEHIFTHGFEPEP